MFLDFLQKTIDVYYSLIPRDKPSLERVKNARIIAHRGAHNHPQGIMENTLAAFKRAKELGCWGIELDVHATADKVLVVNHDPTLNRLWKCNRAIADLKFNELRTLVPEVPTLNEVVDAYGDNMHLLIELKTPFHDEEVLAHTLDGLIAGTHYHLLTLDPEIFYSLTHFPQSSLLLVAVHHNVRQYCGITLKENYGGLLGHYFLINSQIIKRLKRAEKIIGVGMVDSKSSLYRELNRGINWIFTNRAEELTFYVRQFE